MKSTINEYEMKSYFSKATLISLELYQVRQHRAVYHQSFKTNFAAEDSLVSIIEESIVNNSFSSDVLNRNKFITLDSKPDSVIDIPDGFDADDRYRFVLTLSDITPYNKKSEGTYYIITGFTDCENAPNLKTINENAVLSKDMNLYFDEILKFKFKNGQLRYLDSSVLVRNNYYSPVENEKNLFSKKEDITPFSCTPSSLLRTLNDEGFGQDGGPLFKSRAWNKEVNILDEDDLEEDEIDESFGSVCLSNSIVSPCSIEDEHVTPTKLTSGLVDTFFKVSNTMNERGLRESSISSLGKMASRENTKIFTGCDLSSDLKVSLSHCLNWSPSYNLVLSLNDLLNWCDISHFELFSKTTIFAIDEKGIASNYYSKRDPYEETSNDYSSFSLERIIGLDVFNLVPSLMLRNALTSFDLIINNYGNVMTGNRRLNRYRGNINYLVDAVSRVPNLNDDSLIYMCKNIIDEVISEILIPESVYLDDADIEIEMHFDVTTFSEAYISVAIDDDDPVEVILPTYCRGATTPNVGCSLDNLLETSTSLSDVLYRYRNKDLLIN